METRLSRVGRVWDEGMQGMTTTTGARQASAEAAKLCTPRHNNDVAAHRPTDYRGLRTPDRSCDARNAKDDDVLRQLGQFWAWGPNGAKGRDHVRCPRDQGTRKRQTASRGLPVLGCNRENEMTGMQLVSCLTSGSMGLLTGPHQMSFSDDGSLTMRLSSGDRPVFLPE